MNNNLVLTKALLGVGRVFGFSTEDLVEITGVDENFEQVGIDPKSLAGKSAIRLLHIFKLLVDRVGKNPASLHHWMNTPNNDTGGVPAQQVRTKEGMVKVRDYLDGCRR